MTTNDELESLLWDYVYGLLSPDDARALEERITSEHDVARAYAEVRQRADQLGAAARIEAAPVTLVTPAPRAVARERDPSRSLPWLLSGAALVLVALLGYTATRHRWLYSPEQIAQVEHALAAEHTRLIVTGPVEVRPEFTNLFSVRLQNLNGDAVAHEEFGFALVNDHDQVVEQAMVATDEAGQGVVAIDGNKLTSTGTLKLWCAASKAPSEVQLSLARVEPALATYLTTDKPTYQPGDTLYFRALTLPPQAMRWHYQPPLNYLAVAPSGETIGEPIVGLANQGVANGAIRLPDDAPAGRYGLLAQTTDGGTPLPQLRSGELLNEFLRAPEQPPSQTQLQFFPEGGGLVPGLENKVFFSAVDADNTPVELRGEIVDQHEHKVAEVATTFAGRGFFTLRPKADDTYWFKPAADVTVDATTATPLAVSTTYAQLKTPQPVLPPGGALEVEVTTTKTPAQFLVAANSLGATIGQQFVDFSDASATQEPATQHLQIPLAKEADGLLDVTLYDCSASPPQPLANRVAYRAPERFWTIQLTPDASSNNTHAVWNVRVADERGRAGRALLGVSVVTLDDAATPPPQLAAIHGVPILPTEIALRLQNEPEEAADRRALDLLLGTLPTAPPALAFTAPQNAAHEFAGGLGGAADFGAKALGSGENAAPRPQIALSNAVTTTARPPALVDNLAEVQKGYEQAVLAWRTRQESRAHTFALTIAIGSLTLLLACAMVLLLRLTSPLWAWMPAAGGLLTLAIASVWLGGKIDRPLQVTVQPIAAYYDPPLVTATSQTTLADADANDDSLAPLPIQRFRYDAREQREEKPATAPTTLLWDPLLSTNDHGEAQLHFALPQPAPRYRIRIDAHGDGRLGSVQRIVDAPPMALPAPAQE